MTLAPTALTTLDTMLDELELESDGGTQDARLERYIMTASSAFASMCGRALHYAEDHTERVGSAGGVYLVVSDYTPIVSIDEIAWVGSDGAESVVDDSAYGFTDKQARAGKIECTQGAWTSTEVHRQRIEATPTGRSLPRYKVTYTGGYVTPQQAADDASLERTLPYDIEDAVIQMVIARHHARGRDRTISSKKVGPASIGYTNAELPDSIERTVAKYKRRAFA